MRIGMDVSLLLYPEVVGMRISLERLLDALLRAGHEHHFLLFYHTRRSWYGIEPVERFLRPNSEIVAAPLPVRCTLDSMWWLGFHPPLEWLLRTPLDVFHAGDFLWPRSKHTPLVGTLHDLTPELFPELHVWPNRVRHGAQMRWFAKHARRIISISRSSAQDFVRLFGEHVPIDVVHPALGVEVGPPDPAAVASMRRRAGLGEAPYLLSVSTIEPRKNGERVIRAFELAFANDENPPHLVFAGQRGWLSDAVYSAAANSPLTNHIHFTGRLGNDEVAALYHGALALVFPSLYEGFGLPALEAMHAGVPVLTSNVSSMPEIVGDAGLLVDPTDVDAISAGLRRLCDDHSLRDRLRAAGRERAVQFSWETTARKTLAVYERASGIAPARNGS
jgi:glycosyltransferase involved in cell wall biosynthesis